MFSLVSLLALRAISYNSVLIVMKMVCDIHSRACAYDEPRVRGQALLLSLMGSEPRSFREDLTRLHDLVAKSEMEAGGSALLVPEMRGGPGL